MRIRKRRALAVLLAYAALFLISAAAISDLASAGSARAPAPRNPPPPNNLNAPAPAAARGTSAVSTADGNAFFESKIRPVLVKNCYSCHSASVKDLSGGLLLDSKQALRRGGDDGPAIIPGNPDASLLIKAIRYTDKDLQMPPSGKLSDSIIKDFESWVKMGAPDTRDGASPLANKNYDTEQAKKWWSFQPLHRPAPAKVADAAWPKGDIDKFVLASLESKQIKPNPDTDKTTLIRRVSFDLVGLPPTPEDIDAFLADSSPDAYAKLVDKLLASPQFGERWGRHWLDVARYAESTGKDSNMTYPDAWRYRDYVIAAFNSDKPYDQFIREQLAGDLLPAATPKKKAEQQIATGFLAMGPKSLTEQISRQFALDQANEQVDATTTCFMALTVSCARCHDHKFDPILQRDFYSMAGIFLSTRTKYGTLPGPRNNEPSDLIELSPASAQPTVKENLTPQNRDQLKKDLASATADYNELLAGRGQGGGVGNQIQQALGLKSHLEAQLNAYDSAGHPKAFCMGVEDRPPTVGRTLAMAPMNTRRGPLARLQTGFETIADSPLFFRGEASEPRDRVPRGIPTFLVWSGMTPIPPSESGRRELANWISSPKNPLTARVMANRLWHWLMGQGIVASVDNFGTMGEAPADQPLLDHLANRLIDNNWSLKKTIREIVMSRTYQLASTYSDESFQADPQNALCWRHSQTRLDAECLRDAMLSVSGQLDLKPPVGSMVALAGDGAISAGPPFMRINENPFINAAGFNRSVYLPVIREVEPDAMGLFDFPDTNLVIGDRESTNVPSQALYLINSDYVHVQARRMGQRIIAAYPGRIGQPRIQAARVDYAFRLAYGRNASAAEQKTATDFFATIGGPDGILPGEAWGDFCLALFNTAEFRYLK